MDVSGWPINAYGYATLDIMLDDYPSQIASSNLPMPSQPTAATRTPNVSSKNQRSTMCNNSLHTSSLDRRKRLNDGTMLGRHFMELDKNMPTSHPFFVSNALPGTASSNNPVDWCSMSSPEQQFLYTPTYSTPAYPDPYSDFSTCSSTSSEQMYLDLLSSPTSHSFPDRDLPVDFFPNSISMPFSQTYSLDQNSKNGQEMYLNESMGMDDKAFQYKQSEWDNLKMQEFDNLITSIRPTQDSTMPLQVCTPVPSNDTTSCQTSLPNETDGEELFGMGLYDSPELSESPFSRQFYNYPSSAMVPSCGKGLKLEETWNPPDENVDDGTEARGSEVNQAGTVEISSPYASC
ncbi:hypothetical protein K3495_g920 [Podosphaera aphanis]|nr:hypothetical protein K3495_g920 [Podosphaera aphanis]